MTPTTSPTTLFVTDMDGTLLNDDSRVSSKSAATLNPLLDQGVLFTVATARTPATVVPLLSQLHMRLPFIVLNGAAMWDSLRGDFSHVNVIDPSTVEAVCAIYQRHGIDPFVYRRHGSIIHAHHSGPLSCYEEEFVEQRQGLALKKFILHPHPILESADDAMLIFSMQHYERLRPIYEEVSALPTCSAVFYHDIFHPEAGLLEIYAHGVSKASAVKQLKAMTGAERLVVFGDNRNDIPMMQVADHAVAVANAFSEVKAAASEVIAANTQNAVPLYILKYGVNPEERLYVARK